MPLAIITRQFSPRAHTHTHTHMYIIHVGRVDTRAYNIILSVYWRAVVVATVNGARIRFRGAVRAGAEAPR